jgi:hypothetical protein
MHWAVANGKKVELQNAVGWLVKGAKIPALSHASIWLEWTPSVHRRRDTDNPEPTRKACIDAIVSVARILPDDTPEYVTRPENVIREPQRGLPSLLLVIEGSLGRGVA